MRLANDVDWVEQYLQKVRVGAPSRPARRPIKTSSTAAPVSLEKKIAPDPKEEFSRLVAGHLDGPVLRYSARIQLIREGMRRGIGRFDCNLLIAVEEHRARTTAPEDPPAAWPVGWITFAVLQSAIFATAWWVLA